MSRTEATHALRFLVSTAARDPHRYALHSGRTEGASHDFVSARGVRGTDTENEQMEIESSHGVCEGWGGRRSLRVTSTGWCGCSVKKRHGDISKISISLATWRTRSICGGRSHIKGVNGLVSLMSHIYGNTYCGDG